MKGKKECVMKIYLEPVVHELQNSAFFFPRVQFQTASVVVNFCECYIVNTFLLFNPLNGIHNNNCLCDLHNEMCSLILDVHPALL